MKHIYSKLFLYFSLLSITTIGVISCNDFIEKDISGKIPSMILPNDGDTIAEFSSFIWNEVEGATKYRLEIHSPSFNNPNFIAIDTVVTSTDINLTLSPNDYQLRLKALNNGYESLFMDPINITVDTIPSNQLIIDLISPSLGDYYSESFDGNFSWSSLPNISSYEISLRSGTDFQTGSILYSQNNITTTSHIINGVDLEEGEYIWGVKAILNNGNTTSFFTSTFKIDETDPVIPTPMSPNDNQAVLSPVEFSWSNAQDGGVIQSPVETYLEIATDTTFNTVVSSDHTSQNSVEITLNQTGSFYWRLYNLDEAGNQSDYSNIREFSIN